MAKGDTSLQVRAYIDQPVAAVPRLRARFWHFNRAILEEGQKHMGKEVGGGPQRRGWGQLSKEKPQEGHTQRRRPIPTFHRQGVWPCLLKIDHHSTLDLLHQRLQTLVQHALGEDAVGAACQASVEISLQVPQLANTSQHPHSLQTQRQEACAQIPEYPSQPSS